MDCDQYKLFVGGIPRETSEESLKQHFSRYGAVLGALVAKERATGQPRGFGFVRFANALDVDKALTDSHFILGRAVSSTLCSLLICPCLVSLLKGSALVSIGFCFLLGLVGKLNLLSRLFSNLCLLFCDTLCQWDQLWYQLFFILF